MIYIHTHCNRYKWHLVTFAVAIAGVFVCSVLSVPLPFLFGPLFGCLLFALLGVPLQSVGALVPVARTVLGVAVGAAITPALFATMFTMLVSIALVPLFIIGCLLIGMPLFRFVHKLDTTTAYYASMPGGLQDMVTFGIEAGSNPRALSLIHATRVLFIVTLAPYILINHYGVALDAPIGASVTELGAFEIVLMLIAALFGWRIAARLGLFGAAILGPMIFAAVLSLLGLLHNRPPKEAILFAQFFIGTGLGVYFVGVTLTELRKVVFAGFMYVVLLSVLAAGFSYLVTWFELGQPVEAFLAFVPGGQAEMAVMAIASGSNLGYVVTHHLVRIALVISCAPLIIALAQRLKPNKMLTPSK